MAKKPKEFQEIIDEMNKLINADSPDSSPEHLASRLNYAEQNIDNMRADINTLQYWQSQYSAQLKQMQTLLDSFDVRLGITSALISQIAASDPKISINGYHQREVDKQGD